MRGPLFWSLASATIMLTTCAFEPTAPMAGFVFLGVIALLAVQLFAWWSA